MERPDTQFVNSINNTNSISIKGLVIAWIKDQYFLLATNCSFLCIKLKVKAW